MHLSAKVCIGRRRSSIIDFGTGAHQKKMETLDRKPALSAVCRQRPKRKPCCAGEPHDAVVKFDSL